MLRRYAHPVIENSAALSKFSNYRGEFNCLGPSAKNDKYSPQAIAHDDAFPRFDGCEIVLAHDFASGGFILPQKASLIPAEKSNSGFLISIFTALPEACMTSESVLRHSPL